jgi:hypothetical protein
MFLVVMAAPVRMRMQGLPGFAIFAFFAVILKGYFLDKPRINAGCPDQQICVHLRLSAVL